jgi:hypothetical protein
MLGSTSDSSGVRFWTENLHQTNHDIDLLIPRRRAVLEKLEGNQ